LFRELIIGEHARFKMYLIEIDTNI